MTEEEYELSMNKVRKELEKLTVHSQEQIDIAADQLAGMNADLSMGKLEIDYRNLTKKDVMHNLDEIESMDFEALEKTVNIEKPYDGSMKMDAWSRYSKVNRAELLLRQFTLLSKLRSDDPEAWEEVNELFYDD